MTSRVRESIRAGKLSQQRARLFREARRFLARRYLGNTDPTIEFQTLDVMLRELLASAKAQEEQARRLLAQAVKTLRHGRASPRGRGSSRRTRGLGGRQKAGRA